MKDIIQKFGYRPELQRSMGVWQLTAFGLNYMIPLAPAIVFGLILQATGGTVALPFLLACIAMVFTANSYMLMVDAFPVAGSLYSFVTKGLHPRIGFIAGWVLLLDYVLAPTTGSMSAVSFLIELVHVGNYTFWYLVFVGSMGLINLLGINLVAIVGLCLLFVGELMVLLSFIVWSYAVYHQPIGTGHLLSLAPFHFTSMRALVDGTAIAVLSYLGFDAISTLSEEAIHPKRDIPRAILWSVLIGGATMILTGYLGMIVIPDWQQHINDSTWVNATLFFVSLKAGGEFFAVLYTVIYITGMAIFNVVATAACSRLLFGMGRDNVLPRRFFGSINKRFKTPHYNILLIVAIQCLLGITLDLTKVAELVNFGAMVGFILLNIATFWYFYWKHPQKTWEKKIRCVLFPLIANLTLCYILTGMANLTYIVGLSWLLIGTIYSFYGKPNFKQEQLS